MKVISKILIAAGIIGVIYFGIKAVNQSESFELLGMDVAVSKADWTPLIASGLVLIVGIILGLVRKS